MFCCLYYLINTLLIREPAMYELYLMTSLQSEVKQLDDPAACGSGLNSDRKCFMIFTCHQMFGTKSSINVCYRIKCEDLIKPSLSF